jgi:hypothetical protein
LSNQRRPIASVACSADDQAKLQSTPQELSSG